MKVSALVVAAMVVTSANATVFGSFMDWFWGNGDGLESVSSPASTEPESGASQDPGPTKEGLGDDSGSDAAKKSRICKCLASELLFSQKRMFGDYSDFRIQVSILNKLRDNKENLKTGAMEDRFASYSLVNAKLEAIKKSFTVSDEDYRETYRDFKTIHCSSKFLHLIPPEEMMEISVALKEQMELLRA
ncbi:hypothetical protein BASA60_005265 [Batrachochytrium salamandrivorans]|nr:hypothetical protein BASA62_002359 [Batrachochytrium salamandrivorans]KAH6574919.1 hypothetical protein BASA60_005265 [Batrachochytrium salamandrivorans]KAH9264318.1 hypothetical protein BASA83_012210 [Batrachochytrium salamandrivorans]